MSRAAAVPVITRRKAGVSNAVAACGRVFRLGSMVAVLITLSLVLLGEGAPGDLDPTFGVGGKLTTNFEGREALARALVLQPDGKLVAAGGSTDTASGLSDFTLVRYLPDGGLDPTFGVGGKETTDFGDFASADALVLQPDGKLVAAGFSGPHGAFDFALARYLPDGSLDTMFGTEGKVTTDFGGIDLASALVLQPDGKLVAAGSSLDATNPANEVSDFVLARYLSDGSLDPTFGVEGKVITDFGGFDAAQALVLQPDGKLVAAGLSEIFQLDFALARYLSDGSLDPTFGVGGKVITDFGGAVRAPLPSSYSPTASW